ncbi:glycine betaine/L-proline ABC transporter substrate-binding protein ProX [Martelella mangrovi]|uniref:Glycine betaine/proline transport system substrate-binding protein n=1 Tax=Martelella mangrovi TaxID=1397477 RepID=A0ABV2I945_9HYPH
MKTMLHTLALTAMVGAAGLVPATAGAQEPGNGTTIKMARASWDSGWFQAEIYTKLFEELGYNVEGPTTLDVPPFYQAVMQGDVDLWVNGWFPAQDTYKPVMEGQAEVIGTVVDRGALQGYMVDKAAVEEFGIESLADFARPEVREAFDRNGDGKADLVSCPPGWLCERVIVEQLEDFGLDDDIATTTAGYNAAMADTIASYNAGEHVLYYAWTPNWTGYELKAGEDVMWIPVPQVEGVETVPPAEGLETCVADPCYMGFPPNDIQPVARKDLLEANPAIESILTTVSIPLDDIFAQNAAMIEGDDDIEAQADAWIAENRDAVDGWLETARAAAN